MVQILQLTIAQRIKEEVKTAVQPRKNTLKLLIGELDRISKDPTDKQTEQVLLFLINSVKENKELLSANAPQELMNDSPESNEHFNTLYALNGELAVYLEFLPPQPKVLTKEEIAALVKASEASTVPALMKFLGAYEKEHFVTVDKAYARGLL